MKIYEQEQYFKNRIDQFRKNDFTAFNDVYIRRWPIQRTREMRLKNFKASSEFLKNLNC